MEGMGASHLVRRDFLEETPMRRTEGYIGANSVKRSGGGEEHPRQR